MITLHQAADSTNWPAGIKYDPDSTGVHIYSLGVHEHWNNATDKKYTRNLGTGNGIELKSVEVGATTTVSQVKKAVLRNILHSIRIIPIHLIRRQTLVIQFRLIPKS